MGSDPVTVVANSVHRHDQSIDLGVYDSDTALRLTEMRRCFQSATHVHRFKMLNAQDVVRTQKYYQHDGAPSHFSHVVRPYPNHKLPNRWIGRGCVQNWPPRSPDLNPLDYHVWGYVKAMVYTHKVSTREELLQRILSTARSINNAAVLRRVTSSLVTWVRKWRRRTLQAIFFSVERRICNCIFNSIVQ